MAVFSLSEGLVFLLPLCSDSKYLRRTCVKQSLSSCASSMERFPFVLCSSISRIPIAIWAWLWSICFLPVCGFGISPKNINAICVCHVTNSRKSWEEIASIDDGSCCWFEFWLKELIWAIFPFFAVTQFCV